MQDKTKLSNAQKKALRRKESGKDRPDFINVEPNDSGGIEDYYDLSLKSDEIKSMSSEYMEEYKKLEDEFKRIVKLDSLDIKFLFFATALQCIRQYLITPFSERVDHKTADKAIKSGVEESSNRIHKWYKPSLEEVISNPVPFDAMFGSPDFNLNIGGGFNHRARTLGHDPLLGWIFGTMNIATSTLTTSDFQSFHIKTGFTKSNLARDKITNNADTTKVIKYTIDKMLSGTEERKIIAAALVKEAIHLKSDINTIAGLPIPIVSSISPEFSRTLANYGVDASNVLTVGKQAGLASLINFLIGMIHRLFYNEKKDGSVELYEVRTRKILLYSNSLAMSSNILYTTLSKDFAKLDVGGMMVTIYRLITDTRYIARIKNEFINSKLYEKLDEELKESRDKFQNLLEETYMNRYKSGSFEKY
jgi:hypothetical protein